MSFQNALRNFSVNYLPTLETSSVAKAVEKRVGLIAGNGSFPALFAREAKKQGYSVVAVCHRGETDPMLEHLVDKVVWVRVGELGKMIRSFKQYQVKEVAMAGGINRIRLFGGVKLDARGAALLYRLRSTKDDVIMRGIASEMEGEGIKVISSTVFLPENLVTSGVLTERQPSTDEVQDIRVGISAIKAMSSQDIGQLVVVKEGVIVAVEAVEGSDATIRRGGELGGKGTVVVKIAKPTQDMRFDVPTIGVRTIETMIQAKAKVLAVEAGRCLMIDQAEIIALANKNQITIVGTTYEETCALRTKTVCDS